MKQNKFKNLLFNAVILISAILIFTVLLLKITAKPILENVSFSTAIYDKDNNLMRLTLANDGIYRVYKPLNEISPKLQDAVLLYEDRWFYYHFGVNPVSLFRAFTSLIKQDNRPLGASTITMQLARLKYNINSKTIPGKLKQIFYAVILEIRHNKNEILEAYLNLAPYGHNIEGAEAASLIYFNVNAKDITLFESITLAVIPQNPSKRVPTSKIGMQQGIESRKRIFPIWLKNHPEDASLSSLLDMEVSVRHPKNLPFAAPHFTDYILSRGIRGSVYSTIDMRKQRLLENTVSEYIINNKTKGINNAAVMLLNYKTMEVVSYIGSADYFNSEIFGQVNGVEAMRSPGSALKPFIFGLAIEKGLIHPKSMMKDAPKQYGAYSPENSDRGFMGPLFARDALVHSRNIPAIELLTKLPKSSFYDLLYYSGIENLQPEEYYGTALAIGGFEVTMENVVKMYAGLANLGEEKCINYFKDLKCEDDSYRMFSKEAAFLTVDMLYYNPKPSSVFDNDYIAWKTGTSYAFKDAWTAGILGDYVLVCWVGNFDGTGNHAFLGRTSAGTLFFNIASALKYNENVVYEKQKPDEMLNIKEVDICAPTGDLPNKYCTNLEKGYFIPGISPIKVTDVFRAVPIDKKTGLRACYYDKDTTEMKVYEFWPSDINKLFKKSGIQKQQPPKFMPGCKISITANTGNPPQILSPVSMSTYSIYNDNKKDIAFIVSSDSDAEILYYFIDNRFAGSSDINTPFFWKPVLGSHKLTVTDNLGRSSSVNFKVTLLYN